MLQHGVSAAVTPADGYLRAVLGQIDPQRRYEALVRLMHRAHTAEMLVVLLSLTLLAGSSHCRDFLMILRDYVS